MTEAEKIAEKYGTSSLWGTPKTARHFQKELAADIQALAALLASEAAADMRQWVTVYINKSLRGRVPQAIELELDRIILGLQYFDIPSAPAAALPPDGASEGRGGGEFSLLWAVRTVHDKFLRDREQGYQTRDKDFAIEILGKALEVHGLPSPPPAEGG